jgi:hypothetical protein
MSLGIWLVVLEFAGAHAPLARCARGLSIFAKRLLLHDIETRAKPWIGTHDQFFMGQIWFLHDGTPWRAEIFVGKSEYRPYGAPDEKLVAWFSGALGMNFASSDTSSGQR